jgi:hypothetical protein
MIEPQSSKGALEFKVADHVARHLDVLLGGRQDHLAREKYDRIRYDLLGVSGRANPMIPDGYVVASRVNLLGSKRKDASFLSKRTNPVVGFNHCRYPRRSLKPSDSLVDLPIKRKHPLFVVMKKRW